MAVSSSIKHCTCANCLPARPCIRLRDFKMFSFLMMLIRTHQTAIWTNRLDAVDCHYWAIPFIHHLPLYNGIEVCVPSIVVVFRRPKARPFPCIHRENETVYTSVVTLALALVTLTLSCLARAMISTRFREETLWAILLSMSAHLSSTLPICCSVMYISHTQRRRSCCA